MKNKIFGFFVVVLCTNVSVNLYAQTNVQDSLALVALYNSTNGTNWSHNHNWLVGPVKTWYGISVHDGRVTEIDLTSNQLNGSIPPELGNLDALGTLDLSQNQLSGNIPPELGNLSNLSGLNLFGNQLSGSIPPELGNLAALGNLTLGNNQLIGSIPPELGNLSKLRLLRLDYNQLSGSIPPELGNLAYLIDLRLDFNQLNGSIPSTLGNLSNLDYLDLGNNQLSGSIPPEFGNLSNLTLLYMRHNQLGGSIPSELGNISKLHGLYLDYNQLNGSIPPGLANLLNLSDLFLRNNQLSGSIPPELGNLFNLSQLNLSHNQLSGSIPPQLGDLAYLDFLDISDNQLGGNIPHDIANIGLRLGGSINLSFNYFTFDGMESLVKKHPQNIVYSPQARIPLHFLNDSTLSVSAGGTLNKNTYKWFLVGHSPVTIVGDSVFQPSQDGKYYASITNSVCTQLTLHTDTVDFSNALPVTIIDLKAQLQKSFVQIDWTSVTEINVTRYEIQRSANAINFIMVGSLAAKGNGTARQDYTFDDLQPQQGSNYYRLKIIDNDGKTSYSIIVAVNISNKIITVVYPVPTKDILHIQTNGSASFSLVDQSGKILTSANINGSGTMNVSSIAAGLYYLKNNSNSEIVNIMIAR